MKFALIALSLALQSVPIKETANIKYNEIEVVIDTDIGQKSQNYIYTYSIQNIGQTPILISFEAVNKIARPEHILIELASKEKKYFKFTSKIASARFRSKTEIYVLDTQTRYPYNNEGTIDFPAGKFWMLTYIDTVNTYVPLNLIN